MTTTIKVTVYNGSTKVKFELTQPTNEVDLDFVQSKVYNHLTSIFNKQKRLKTLGLKNNFFGLSETCESMIDIDVITNNEISTIISGVSFKFSLLNKVQEVDRLEAFGIIFETAIFERDNNLLIERS